MNIINRRDLEFALFELLDAESLTARPRFADHSRETFLAALDTAEARLNAVLAQQRQASNQAGYAVLAADNAGVIVAIEAEAGQVVSAGQTVARLARPEEREIAFAVPESRRELVEHATRFEVSMGAVPGRSWKAKLRELSPAADPVLRTYAARATLLEPGDEVELGMSARITAAANGGGTRIELTMKESR